MNRANLVAAVVVVGIMIYTWSGLADFGAGFWDLVAGRRDRGHRVRALIDEVITPVWEANHVWLIFILVTTWTAFSAAFGPFMTTLFVPLALAALGIVLRGANFALRKDAARANASQWASWLFGIASILTPFFLGTSLGAMLDGRVPANAHGNPVSSWWNPVSIMVGLLVVAVTWFLSAVYLVIECARRGMPDLRRYFELRALIAGVVAFLFSIGAAIALYLDEPRMFHRFVHRSIPLLAVGVVGLVAALVLATRGIARGTRIVAIVGVGALVWSWAVAQYPYLLPFSLTISAGAGAQATLNWVLIWFLVALATVIPFLILLYTLDQRGRLGEDPLTSRHGPQASPAGAAGSPPAAGAEVGSGASAEAGSVGIDASADDSPSGGAQPSRRRHRR